MTYSAIADVSAVVVELLKRNVDERSPLDPNEIELVAPGDGEALSNADLAVCPYRVETDVAMGSASRSTAESGTTRGEPPLSLAVRYLVTAYAVDDGEGDDESRADPFEHQERLGTALQILHDNGRIDPADAPVPLLQEQALSISIVDEPLEELLSLWSQVPDASYQPSATIEVAPVLVQSLNEEEFTRVEERETQLGRRADEPGERE